MNFSSLIRKLVLAPTLVAFTIPFVGVDPAAASAEGCTGAPNGYVCVQVEGSGLRVNRLGAVRGKVGLSGICNYQAKVEVTPPGEPTTTYWSPVHEGCSYLRAWFDWYPSERYWPDQTTVCSFFYESGVQQGGHPCVTIHD